MKLSWCMQTLQIYDLSCLPVDCLETRISWGPKTHIKYRTIFNDYWFYSDTRRLDNVLFFCCSSSAIYDVSLKEVRRAMHRIVKNGCDERLPMEQEINLRAGLNSRPPSRKSRWCCLSRLWMAIQRHCWPTRRPPPRSCVNSCLSGSAWRISLAFRCTSLSLTRSA